MALFSMPAAVEALDDLLDHERQMILAGKIDALLRMGPEKERLMARLPRSVLDPDALVRLRKKAERNQDLLLAAARGIKAASKRIEAMKATSPITTSSAAAPMRATAPAPISAVANPGSTSAPDAATAPLFRLKYDTFGGQSFTVL